MINITYRQAKKADLVVLLKLLADDSLGVKREDPSQPLNPRYIAAFTQITKDPNNELIVLEVDGVIAGMLQLTFIPYLTYIGSWRCLIEGVRVAAEFRGQGLGQGLFEWAIKRASEHECALVQLTSNKQRSDALRFYERLGFTPSHEGFKLNLQGSQ